MSDFCILHFACDNNAIVGRDPLLNLSLTRIGKGPQSTTLVDSYHHIVDAHVESFYLSQRLWFKPDLILLQGA
jgi:hypothetical protein